MNIEQSEKLKDLYYEFKDGECGYDGITDDQAMDFAFDYAQYRVEESTEETLNSFRKWFNGINIPDHILQQEIERYLKTLKDGKDEAIL